MCGRTVYTPPDEDDPAQRALIEAWNSLYVPTARWGRIPEASEGAGIDLRSLWPLGLTRCSSSVSVTAGVLRVGLDVSFDGFP
jgi:hypothetical protein